MCALLEQFSTCQVARHSQTADHCSWRRRHGPGKRESELISLAISTVDYWLTVSKATGTGRKTMTGQQGGTWRPLGLQSDETKTAINGTAAGRSLFSAHMLRSRDDSDQVVASASMQRPATPIISIFHNILKYLIYWWWQRRCTCFIPVAAE